jgi:hypothetical protein
MWLEYKALGESNCVHLSMRLLFFDIFRKGKEVGFHNLDV